MKITKVLENINIGPFAIIDKVQCDDGLSYARKLFKPSDTYKSDDILCKRLQIRFIREVKTQKILPNEFFMPILFDDLNGFAPYFIMPLADDVFTNEIRRSKAESRNPEGLSDILNALEFLHEKGLVHRDLKPQNILKHDNCWKLADFGLVSQDKEILSQTITTSKQAFGTTMYCAPEQITDFNRITPQADIYSFGAILHDIFTDGNRVPHSELTAAGEIGQIITKCTRHKKEQRFQSVKSIRAKLLTLLSNDSSASVSEDDLAWQTKFDFIDSWQEDVLENFIFYIKKSSTIGGLVFPRINDEIIIKFLSINRELFYEFSLVYLDWVLKSRFTFDYCDVVVNNIYTIYSNSKDIEVKSHCAIAAAEIGWEHNRWYVMRYVVKMCDKLIDSNLAFRIAMDIELDSKNKTNFKKCVIQINQSIASYHPLIQEVLS